MLLVKNPPFAVHSLLEKPERRDILRAAQIGSCLVGREAAIKPPSCRADARYTHHLQGAEGAVSTFTLVIAQRPADFSGVRDVTQSNLIHSTCPAECND